MRRRAPGVGAVVALTLCGLVASAQEVELRAYLQPDGDVRLDQTVRLVVEVKGAGRSDLVPPDLSGLVNLKVVAGPERRFSSSWTNGRMSSSAALVYTLVPREEGEAEVPALELVVGGDARRTRPIRVRVLAPREGAAPPGRGEPRRSSEPATAVFVRGEPAKREAFVGEVVPWTLELVTDERVGNPDPVDQPSFAGFWVEETEVDPNVESYTERVNGRRFTVYPLVRRLLIPQTAGELEIEPWTLRIPVRRPGSDPFRIFQLDRMQDVVRRTAPSTLSVRPLPVEGRPESFDGAVGRFELEVEVDRTEVPVNEAITLTARVAGEGSLRSVAAPALESPPDLKVFDPTARAERAYRRGALVSEREWEWVLVPLAPGELVLPELTFAYFDPVDERYVVARAKPPTLLARAAVASPDPGFARQDVRLERRELAYIKPMRGERLGGTGLPGPASRTFLVLGLLPLVWAPLWIGLGRRRAHLAENRPALRARRARPAARRRLATARKLLDADPGRFHEELAGALTRYVADRTDRSAAGLTHEETDRLLAERGVDEELRRRLRSCLESCDFARFVPGSDAADRRSALLADARDLIESLEKRW